MAQRVTLAGTLQVLARQTIADLEGGRLVAEALAGASLPSVIWAVGKAAPAMVRGAVERFGLQAVSGFGITKQGLLAGELHGLRWLEANHPFPGEETVAATVALLADAQRRSASDRILLLLSGGTSALIGAPVDGVELSLLSEATRLLLSRGASIEEINLIRRHLGRLLGGRLLFATAAKIEVLALSDVIGDDPATIGSGPVSPDRSTVAEAVAVADRYRLSDSLKQALLKAGETPKPGDPAFARVRYRVLASPQSLLDGAQALARRAGFEVEVRGALVTGSVDLLADELAEVADRLSPGQLWLTAGEPTVEASGDGRGGRAQHLALMMAERLCGRPITFVACASDGNDGSTDAAGAFVDGATWLEDERGAAAALRAFDSHSFLSAHRATIGTGPTGTNLTDLFLLARAR